MPAPDSQPALSLIREIEADADRACRTIFESARTEAAEWLQSQLAQASHDAGQQLDKARAEASRLADSILATLPLEQRRHRAARIECLLDNLRAQIEQAAHAKASSHPDRTTVTLAAEAIRQMQGDAFRIRVSPACATLPAQDLTSRIAARLGRPTPALEWIPDPSILPGEVIVQDASGRQRADQRLAARLARLWPDLRCRIASTPGLFVEPPPAPHRP